MKNTGVRSNITDYMQSMAVQEWKEFEWAHTKEDLLEQLRQTCMTKKSSRLYHMDRLEKSLKASGIKADDLCDLLDTKNGEEKVRERIKDSFLPEDWKEIEKKLFAMLHKEYLSFPTSSSFMERLVKDPIRGLADEEFRKDSVRVAIVKQFMKYTSYKTAAVKTIVKEKLEKKFPGQTSFDLDTIISHIDESIFDDHSDKPLLKLADDLQSGNFRTNGRTRKDLYMFAFAFGMTSSFEKDDLEYDERTDIEKNLFQDYYTDNLLRYISDEYKKDSRRFDAEPSGAGINYKNFAEVIYLYYLGKDGMSAEEKIKEAESLIKEIKKCMKEGPSEQNEFEYQKTRYFKDICNEEQVSKLSRDNLKNFIMKKYNIPQGRRSSADITIDEETRTASECLSSIYIKILELNGETEISSTDTDSIYQWIQKSYSEFSSKDMVKDYRIAIEEILMDYREDDDFVLLIEKLDKKLDISKKVSYLQEQNNKTLTSDLQKQNKTLITRADLIAAGFYYFQLKYLEYKEDEKIISLQDVYEEFRDFIDNYLEYSRFQKINPKNIFDMYVVSSLYQAVNFS